MNKSMFVKRQSLLLLFSICTFLSLQAQSSGLNIDPITSCNGKTITIEIHTNTWTDVTSMQFTLAWDTNALQFVDKDKPNDTFADLMFGVSNTSDGKLTVSWLDNTTNGISVEDEVAFTVTFNVVGENGDQSNLSFESVPTSIEFTKNIGNNLTIFDPTLVDGLIKVEIPTINGSTITPANGQSANGAISIDVTSGTGPYIYQWNNDQATPSITNLVAGDYQCTVTDNNVCSSILGPFTVESIASSTNKIADLTTFNLSPNPAADFVNLAVAFAKNEQTNIRIIDVMGKTQYRTSKEGNEFQLSIPVANLANGTYFLELSTTQGTVIEKLVIAK